MIVLYNHSNSGRAVVYRPKASLLVSCWFILPSDDIVRLDKIQRQNRFLSIQLSDCKISKTKETDSFLKSLSIITNSVLSNNLP